MRTRLELPGGALADGVVRLRHFGADDEDWVFTTCSTDREISRWTRVPWPYEREHARDFLARAPAHWEAGTDATLAITDAAGGRRLGAVGIHRIGGVAEGDAMADEVGYWLAADARGHGFASRAVVLVTAWAFTTLGRPALVLQVKPENERSRRVAERAGFRRTPEADRHDADGLIVYQRGAPGPESG